MFWSFHSAARTPATETCNNIEKQLDNDVDDDDKRKNRMMASVVGENLFLQIGI